ncbi:MAG: hypothetical protein QME83_00600 [Thermodesulfobacteriota bacterium]|nr:hypothetical protein [Thermodesulfobacteriota bacterium]
MKKKNRTVLFIILLFLLIFISWSFAEEKKKYPPYPDVWGYRLPIAEGISPLVSVGKMANGDYIVSYDKEKKEDGFYRFLWITFFAGVNKEFEKDEWGKFWKKMREEKRELEYESRPKITFSDGSAIEYRSPHGWGGGGRCDDPFAIFFHKKDKDGKIVGGKTLLYLYDKPVKDDLNPYCERNMNYNKNYYFKKVENIHVGRLLPLEDDTFLILFKVPNSLLFIRFDRNFNTKRSDLLGKDIFLLDRKAFADIRNKLTDGNDQAVNDALSAYLTSIRKEGEK